MKKLLIANRGEIAVRVMRSAREAGIATVAVYSDADEQAVHVGEADEAVWIGPSEAGQSYLAQEKVIKAALDTGADAIHPGYGFLSENASFVEACQQNGIIFVGPSAEAMRKLGSKIDAKKLAVESGVPIAPGYFEPGASAETLKIEAEKIGYPVMLKASAGGGGRGMRVVRTPEEFDDAHRLAVEEARKAFGDDAMMVEKLIDRPRHIEVQILADHHGNVACLFERECTLQRRHQKVIEEAPSPVMSEEMWAKMQEASRKLILNAGYTGAGTVEFVVDGAATEFYFLEVNARLQVEHPVTEAITGLDLVKWQLAIADGARLELSSALMTGDRSAIRGHAIEARIIAEDPAHGFLPSVGRLVGWAEPSGFGVRFDTGFRQGSEVSQYYDSLLAKLIVHGDDRSAAIRRLERALADTHILGAKTNVSFLFDVAASETFATADFDTGTLAREWSEWSQPADVPDGLFELVKSVSRPLVASASGAATGASPAWGLQDDFRNFRN